MRIGKRVAALLIAVLALQASVYAAEYFVNKQGADANNGASKATAFLAIQKGVNALKPGDTLTIGPGEYAENVKLREFGDLNRETVIRAEVPGTVVLRGDQNVDLEFSLVPGSRFVYTADCAVNVLSVHEADTLTNLAEAADAFALEFAAGRYFHDTAAKKLYVSSSDFQPSQKHRYTVGVRKDHGIHMFKCRRIVLDGLAASGYKTPPGNPILLLPVSGFMLHECAQCVVRNCTAYFNGSGITINSGVGSNIDRPGEGRGNIVEDCVAYANDLDGVVAYNPSGETIRRCRTFLNETYGARFYGGRAGDALCLMDEVVAWGNPGGDYWTKGNGLSGFFKEVLAERCVAFRSCMFANFQHGLIGGGAQRGGERPTTIDLPNDHKEFLEFLDMNFADPLNYDFRPQATSSFGKPGEGGTHLGLYPYKPDVYYVKIDGNDGADGHSMTNALKTPAAAVRKLKPGDTLYIASGRYAGDLTVTAKDVKIRGRGIEPTVLTGGLRIVNGDNVSIERLEFSGAVQLENGKNVAFANCIFSGTSVEAQGVEGLDVNHGLIVPALRLTRCSNVTLSGNLYAAAPAVQTDSLDAIRYSSYNSYPDAARCWEAGGKALSLDDLRPRQDAQSAILVPELAKNAGVTTLPNADAFGGRGPLSTAIGPYREWQQKEMHLMGPFADSKSQTSADIEWWSTLPVQVDLCWGDTPACANRKQVTQNAFYSYSLLGLEPGKTYYVKVVPQSISPDADPARRFRLAEEETEPVKFVPGGEQAHQPTTYYVAPNGNDARDGLSRQTARKSLQSALNNLRPGDTLLLGKGTYPGTFYFRATGEPDKPITVKAVPGEKVIIHGMGETLHAGFVLYGKHHYRVDSLYFTGYAGIEDNVGGKEGSAISPRNSADLQITRCHFSNGWGRCLEPHECNDLFIQNCVFKSSMEAVMIYNSGGVVIENSVFIEPLITHLHLYGTYGNVGKPGSVSRCIFSENTRHKVHVCPVSIDGTVADNCFYMRWAADDRLVFNDKTLPQHRAAGTDGNSLYANPYMPGAYGFRQGWQQVENDYKSDDPYEPIEFYRLFATNPEVVLRDIGLQPEAFRDFHFWKENWPYTKEWAKSVKDGMEAAEKLREAGQPGRASAAYVALWRKFPMSDRLKTDVLDRAAQCSVQAKDYAQAMRIAETIPLRPFLIRRCMAILIEQKNFAEIVRQATGNSAPDMGWFCPETEEVLADAYYYRGLALAETGDMKAAEADMREMVDKGGRLQYSPGPTVLAVAWRRLADFYRTYAKNNAKAQEALRRAQELE